MLGNRKLTLVVSVRTEVNGLLRIDRLIDE